MPNLSIKVMTYNIHKGFSIGNRRFILHDIKDSLRHVDADVVFLQEILGERTITRPALPADVLADHEDCFPRCWSSDGPTEVASMMG